MNAIQVLDAGNGIFETNFFKSKMAQNGFLTQADISWQIFLNRKLTTLSFDTVK